MSASLRILVVEDEAAMRRALQRQLRAYRVLVAGSYDEAREILQREDFDVIISDNEMPGRSGLEVLRLCNRLQPDARCIMVSGHPPDDLPRQLEQGIIHHFFAKPEMQPLLELIGTLHAAR